MRRVILVFQTDQGKAFRLTIPYAKAGLTTDAVVSAMEQMIDSGVLKGSTGKPTAVMDAHLQEIQDTDLIE
jgi:hypothetical protein